MIIEFLGYPGTGKTYYSRKLVNQNPNIFLNDYTFIQGSWKIVKLKNIVLYMLKNPVLTTKIVLEAFKVKGYRVYALKRVIRVIKQLVIYEKYTEQGNVYCYDQGVAQMLWSFQERTVNTHSVKNCSTLLNKLAMKYNILFVYLFGNERRVLQQLLDRENQNTYFEQLSFSSLQTNYKVQCERLASLISSLSNHRIIKVDICVEGESTVINKIALQIDKWRGK